jgi:hypothetical protein
MKRPVSHLLLFVTLCGFLLAAVAEAQEKTMYTWTDENGVVHFSDIQPQGQQAREEAIPQNESPGSPDPYASQGDGGATYADQKRQQIAANSEAARQKQAVKSAQCASWQAELSRLEPNRRVFYTNEQGETERMDDVKRANRVSELKRQIAQNCQ